MFSSRLLSVTSEKTAGELLEKFKQFPKPFSVRSLSPWYMTNARVEMINT